MAPVDCSTQTEPVSKPTAQEPFSRFLSILKHLEQRLCAELVQPSCIGCTGAIQKRLSAAFSDISFQLNTYAAAASLTTTVSNAQQPDENEALVHMDVDQVQPTDRFSLPASVLPDLVDHLSFIITDPQCPSLLPITGLPDYTDVLSNIYRIVTSKGYSSTTTPGRASVSIQYRPAPNHRGAVHLYQSEKPEWRFPYLPVEPLPLRKPSEQDLHNFFATLVREPPSRILSYYVGMPLTPSDLDDLLDSDSLASALGAEIQGITTLYWHIGGPGSGTAFHCEDSLLRSVNIVVSGSKAWVLIDQDSTEAFEEYMRGHRTRTKGVECDQWVRHEDVLLDPAVLDKAGIKYRLFCQGPGELVVTAPRQYHAVVNYTTCVAVSINFVIEEEDALAPVVQTCKHCGLNGFDHPNIKHVQVESIDSSAESESESESDESQSESGVGPSSATNGNKTPRKALSDGKGKQRHRAQSQTQTKVSRKPLRAARMAAAKAIKESRKTKKIRPRIQRAKQSLVEYNHAGDRVEDDQPVHMAEDDQAGFFTGYGQVEDDQPGLFARYDQTGDDQVGDVTMDDQAGDNSAADVAMGDQTGDVAGDDQAGDVAGDDQAGDVAGDDQSGVVAGENQAGDVTGEDQAGDIAGDQVDEDGAPLNLNSNGHTIQDSQSLSTPTEAQSASFPPQSSADDAGLIQASAESLAPRAEKEDTAPRSDGGDGAALPATSSHPLAEDTTVQSGNNPTSTEPRSSRVGQEETITQSDDDNGGGNAAALPTTSSLPTTEQEDTPPRSDDGDGAALSAASSLRPVEQEVPTARSGNNPASAKSPSLHAEQEDTTTLSDNGPTPSSHSKHPPAAYNASQLAPASPPPTPQSKKLPKKHTTPTNSLKRKASQELYSSQSKIQTRAMSYSRSVSLTPCRASPRRFDFAISQVRQYDDRIILPRGLDPQNRHDAELVPLIAAIRDRRAITQFFTLIASSRQDITNTEEEEGEEKQRSAAKTTKYAGTIIPPPCQHLLTEALGEKDDENTRKQNALIISQITNLFTRNHHAHNNMWIMSSCRHYLVGKLYTQLVGDADRISPPLKELILKQSGMTTAQYNYELSRGKNYLRLCCPDLEYAKTQGPAAVAAACEFEGLLPFLFRDKRNNELRVALGHYFDLDDDQLARFHCLLRNPADIDPADDNEAATAEDEYITKLCVAGSAFIGTLSGPDVYFTWEDSSDSEQYPAKSITELANLPTKTLLDILQPVPHLVGNVCEPSVLSRLSTAERDAVGEAGGDPAMGQGGWCDMCPAESRGSQSCQCYQVLAYPRPEIKIKRSAGFGLFLRASSKTNKAVVFPAGACLGFYTGKLVPIPPVSVSVRDGAAGAADGTADGTASGDPPAPPPFWEVALSDTTAVPSSSPFRGQGSRIVCATLNLTNLPSCHNDIDKQTGETKTLKCAISINSREAGSMFRLLHYACAEHAVAELVPRRVSGFWALVVLAKRHIVDGEMITVAMRDDVVEVGVDGVDGTQTGRTCVFCGKVG